MTVLRSTPPPPPKSNKSRGCHFWGWSRVHWDKIVKFLCFMLHENIVVPEFEILPDLPATFRPKSTRPWGWPIALHFETPSNLPIFCHYLRNFKDFLCSKLDFGLQIHNRLWFLELLWIPKMVFIGFGTITFTKSKILDFVRIFRHVIPGKGVPYVSVRFKGGGNHVFQEISNLPILKYT